MNTKLDEVLVHRLSSALDSTTTLIQNLHSELVSCTSEISTLRERIQGIHERVDGLHKVVQEGSYGLTNRTLTLEKDIKVLQEWKTKADAEEEATEKDDKSNSRQVKLAIFGAGLAIITSFGFWEKLFKLMQVVMKTMGG